MDDLCPMNSGHLIETGIYTCENDNTTYLYLCGIHPEKEIQIDSSTTLMPVSAAADPDNMIDCIMKYGSGDEFQLGLLISTLRGVTAQIKITAMDAKELAIQAWNAQHICVQISAILHCELAWYFQASDPADRFSSHTRVSLICPNMYKYPSSITTIPKEKCDYLEEVLPIALEMEGKTQYATASNALWSYRINFRPSVQMSILWGGIESLFLIERRIKKRLSQSSSHFLCGDDSFAEEIEELYERRCKAVHELENCNNSELMRTADILHRLLLKCIEKRDIPNVSILLNEL